MIVKTTLAVFIALVLALAITYSINDWYITNFGIKSKQDAFYSQNFDPNKNKVYLIGASPVNRLNATYIEEYISQTEKDYEIYNLAINTDSLENRINSLQEIIDSNPVMVVYGIGFRDVGDSRHPIPITDVITLPKPTGIIQEAEFFSEWIPFNDRIDFSILENPQLITLRIFKLFAKGEESVLQHPPKNPFAKYYEDMYKIVDEDTLKQNFPPENFVYIVTISDYQVDNLKKIITTLKKNDIKVVLYTYPYSKVYLDNLDDSDFELFISTLEGISDEFDVPVHHLYDKYADLNIWQNPTHVSLDKTAIVYSDDLAKIILSEIEQ